MEPELAGENQTERSIQRSTPNSAYAFDEIRRQSRGWLWNFSAMETFPKLIPELVVMNLTFNFP